MKVSKKTYVYDNRALANEAMKRMPQGDCCLGAKRTTVFDVAADAWDLWGDGRRIVGAPERTMIVLGLLDEHGLNCSMGTALQISSFIGKCFLRLKEASFMCSALSINEQAVLDVANEYSKTIESLGLIELSEALWLVRDRIETDELHCVGSIVVDEPLRGLLGEGAERARGEHGEAFGKACKEVGFAMLLAEGRSIVDRMVFDEVKRQLSCGAQSIAVIADEAAPLFGKLAPLIERASAKCALRSSVRLQGTRFGSFILASCKLMSMASMHGLEDVCNIEDAAWIPVASDVASSVYAKISAFSPNELGHPLQKSLPEVLSWRDLNPIWRADRLLRPNDAANDLSAVSAGFSAVLQILSEGGKDFEDAIFEDVARTCFDGLQRSVELEAIRSVSRIIASLRETGQPISWLPLFLESATVSASIASNDASFGAEGRCEVYFLDTRNAKELYPRTFDEVLLCDVSDQSLNAKSQRTSVDAIAEAMGIFLPSLKEQAVSQTFESCVLAAKQTFACVYPKRGADSQESFPSCCIEDFFERRFGGGLSFKKVSSLVPGGCLAVSQSDDLPSIRVECAGEGDFVSGVGREMATPSRFETVPAFQRGELAYVSLPSRMRHAQTSVGNLPCISPSAIEAYLGCPYKWFIEHIIQPQSPDENFGPLECGSFAHEVLDLFYRRLVDTHGTSKVSCVPEEQVDALFRDVVTEVLEAQYMMDPLSGRYVPSTPSEKASAFQLANDIKESVLLEGMFPERFKAVAREHRIGSSEAGPLQPEYAGFALNGRVDRIDSDEGSGTFVVVDYKGGISAYDAGEKCVSVLTGDEGPQIDPETLPEHVQALVYAKVLQESGEFGRECDAALYTSYRASKAKCLAVGSYRADDEELAAISDAKSAVSMSMGSFLALVEKAVESRISPIGASDISIEPSNCDACRYCPVSFCEGR